MIIVYYSFGFTEPALNFKRQISKSVLRRFANKEQNLNASLVKPSLCNIFSYFCLMILIDAIKPNVIKNKIKIQVQNLFKFFTRQPMGEGYWRALQDNTMFV